MINLFTFDAFQSVHSVMGAPFFYNLIEYFPVNLFVSLAIYLSVCLITNFSPLSNFNCFALRTAYVS